MDEVNAGERLYPGASDVHDIDVEQHLARYNLAKQYIKSGRVLDAACGSGYGSSMLAKDAEEVLGLDISDHALSWARDNYKESNLEFQVADLNQPLALHSESFDGVTSFETIEHLTNQDSLVQEFKRVMKPDAALIISCPNQAFSDLIQTVNPFHTKEFHPMEFKEFLGQWFSRVDLYGQTKVQGISQSKKKIRQILNPLVPGIKKVLGVLGLKDKVAANFTEQREAPANFEKIESEPAVIYQNLIAVCRK